MGNGFYYNYFDPELHVSNNTTLDQQSLYLQLKQSQAQLDQALAVNNYLQSQNRTLQARVKQLEEDLKLSLEGDGF